MTAPTLTEFLFARIAEDEDVAHEASTYNSESWEMHPNGRNLLAPVTLLRIEHSMTVGEHIARHDPARVLAECAAKGRIVSECDALIYEEREDPDSLPTAWAAQVAREVLWSLAFPYSDHPDFSEAWRP